MTSKELYAKEREIKTQIVASLRALIGDKKIELGEESFEDDCNNIVQSFDRENIYCQNTVYCINDLSVDDGIYLVALLEK